MSLYYEAAATLANPNKTGGSLKSRVYKQTDVKSSPAQIFALITETSKWSPVLKTIIERSGLLQEEKKLTPLLALLLTHDLLLAKTGVAAPTNHVLKLAITRHKARLGAELTKVRLLRGCATLDALRHAVNDGSVDTGPTALPKAPAHPRWVRVNTLKTTLDEQLSSTFAGYEETKHLSVIMSARSSSKTYFIDPNIPNLLAFPPKIELSKSTAYVGGQIIFQDKASCFPAYLLDVGAEIGDIIDGCAAPGNKTTQLAAIVSAAPTKAPRHVIAFERDKARASTLEKMVNLASADNVVTIKGGQDFLAAQPGSEEYSKTQAILLDPSCSGSGIVGRDDTIEIQLPTAPESIKPNSKGSASKKRKRTDVKSSHPEESTTLKLEVDNLPHEESPEDNNTSDRLTALSTFQLRILTHAMRFPQARRITYSTCSIHCEENESVVLQALQSTIAKERGWAILKREQQVTGLRDWQHRGIWDDGKLGLEAKTRDHAKEEILDACIRCEKGTDAGTMGFFVAAFTRHGPEAVEQNEDEWNGFSDEEAMDNAAVSAILQSESTPAYSEKRTKKKHRK
ncbi:putative NOL1/NOP2/sun domain protein [Lophiostoma macrostomum CBS 122681]|uniref:Putative NOL1/NOP2/sun domain protein n=1 Tax=Lophiostoma macrostomum CBS 122681 TaxID=1314788 RepID=A0A6A6TCD4_9PLEO|nr:putative NOL1/NOP2/sun domain protein [Lophiostoma macrostomum CBS 122681]